MSKATQYFCGLCGKNIYNERPGERFGGVGLELATGHDAGWELADGSKTEKYEAREHLCFECISSIQRMTTYCGAGFKHDGGPCCDSDHK